jgi:hypothetical protein
MSSRSTKSPQAPGSKREPDAEGEPDHAALPRRADVRSSLARSVVRPGRRPDPRRLARYRNRRTNRRRAHPGSALTDTNKGDTLLHRPSRPSLITTIAALLVLLLTAVTAALAEPRTENVYAGGQTYQINTGAAVVFDAASGLLQHASPIYIIGFPVAAGTTGPITLPSGYQPQNNGLPSPIPYHDHVLIAAPGQPWVQRTAASRAAALHIGLRVQPRLRPCPQL